MKTPSKCPDWLNAEAKAEWARVAPGVTLATSADEMVLAAYCQNYARWAQAERVIEEHGTEIVLRDDKGTVKSVSPSPQIGISNKALDRMLKAASQLGLRANVTGAKVQAPTVKPAARGASSAARDWFGGVN